MPLNKAYLKSNKSVAGDETYTPYYAVIPLLEFIPNNWRIWCPFDEKWSAYYQTFTENGYDVIHSSLKGGQDFFDYLPPDCFDIIVSNPPYSIKDKVIERLYELNKPFMMLMPVAGLQAKKRFNYFKTGLELLVFNERIDYHTRGDFEKPKKGVHFGSMYFCKSILPEKFVFRELHKFQKPLK
jgi:hypothetical protein